MPRLLLVDDDISEISAVKRVLSRSGHAPLLATNGADALASIGQARPDLLLLGAACQGGEALQAIRGLDDEEATRGIPLIILGEAPGAPERAVQLPRPVDPATLSEQVKHLLSGAQAATPFERRLSSPELPGSIDRRSGPTDPAQARKAAAEALRVRARELRGRAAPPAGERPATTPTPGPSEAAAGLDALFELEPPAGVGAPPAPRAETPFDLAEVPPLDLDLEPPAAPTPIAVIPPADQLQLDAPEPPAEPPDEPFADLFNEPAVEPLSEPSAEPPAEPFAGLFVEPPAAPIAEPLPTAAAAPSTAPHWERAHAEELAARRALEEDLLRLREQQEADRRQHDQELHTVLERATAHEQAALAKQASIAEAAASRAVAAAEVRFGAALEKVRASASVAASAPLFADVPPPDPSQEAARRRALSRRVPADPAAAEASLPARAPWAARAPDAPPAELRGGNLDDLPMARLLAVAFKARAAGRLDVVGDATRALWFEDGHVVGAASNAAGERIDEVALRLGLLTREQHRQVAGAVTGLASRRAGVMLIDRGYLKSGELTILVRARTEEVVFGIFAEVNARFRWVADPVPADERVALDRPPLALAVEGVRRRWLAPRLEPILGGPATLVTPVHGGPGEEELGLLPDERRALSSADGLRTLDEVVAASPLDALSTRQLIAALVLVGALGVKVVQAGRPAAQVSAGIDLARVKEKLEQVRRADYFTILGLGRVATPHEVRAAAERLTAEFQAERYRGHQEEGLPARLEEIRRVVADAREVLADPFLREEYERGLSA